MKLPLLVTPRLILRPWTREDIDTLHAMWTTPDVRRYLWDDVAISRETAEHVVEAHLASSEQHGIGCWALYRVENQESIAGFCGFRFTEDTNEVELLYGLRRQFWGRGLATEACMAAVDYFWNATNYDVLYARTDVPNAPSVRVMERLGMQHQSTTGTTITYMLTRPE